MEIYIDERCKYFNLYPIALFQIKKNVTLNDI